MSIFESFYITCLSGGSLLFILNFVSGRTHLLGTLLSLEGIMLMFFGLMCWMSNTMHSYFFTLIFLTFVACEGALALSLLVLSVRWWGNDRLSTLSMLN